MLFRSRAVDNLEEDLIKNKVIPRLSTSIEPIITQIQRPIVLVVDYVPGENLSVRLTRKRIIIEEPDTKQYSIVHKDIKPSKKTDKTLTSAPKSAWTVYFNRKVYHYYIPKVYHFI